MRGRKNLTANETPPNLPPCKICGEQGTGFHYGVTACGACKGFFRRSLVRKEPYVCTGNGSCAIGPETKRRKSCPKCRHDKCLAVGMSKEAIKTGRYSYVKKSHDIIEMIEHHFQHYVKRKQFGDGKMCEENLEHDLEIPQKKIRSSCALEKISEAFRQPSSEFMELSPTKPSQRSQNAFHFGKNNTGTDTANRISQMSSMTISESVKPDISTDISMSNDDLCPSVHYQHTMIEASDSYPESCMDFRHSEFVYQFNSSSSQPTQSVSTPSPLSLASPMSDISKGPSAPISPPWIDLPIYSNSSYSHMSSDERNSYLSYPDKDYEGDFDSYYKLQRSNDNENLECRDTYYATLVPNDFDCVKQSSSDNEISCPFQPYTLEQYDLCDISTNSSEFHSYNKHNSSLHSSELPKVHTPVSNELERLRRLSWDDINFCDELCVPPYYSVFTQGATKILPKTKSPSKDVDASCFHGNKNEITSEQQANSKNVVTPETISNSYWDLDNTSLQIQDMSSTTAHNKDQFNFINSTQLDHSSIHANHLNATNYCWEKQGSESSTASIITGESTNSPVTAAAQQTERDTTFSWSHCNKTDERNKERHFSMCSEGPSKQSVITDTNPAFANASIPALSISDFEHIIEPAVISATASMAALEEPNEPLNFLNVPIQNDTGSASIAGQSYDQESTITSLQSSIDSDGYSPNDGEIFNNMNLPNTEVNNDDEFLERWTPFSLGGEAPRLIDKTEEGEKSTRLQDNDDDYKNKSLPWCEFTEAELDEVVSSLKTSYQRHVVLDTNLLSDQEIAEKLKSFLDILQLREQTFGKCAPIDREAYFKILEATGIDLGGRREWVENNAKILNRTLQKTVRFFRSVPGFKDICHEDKIVLAKSCMYEYFILSCYRGVNLEKQVILDAEHKWALSMDFIKLVIPEMEDHMLDIFEVSKKLVDLKLSFEETLILKAISIISPDRDKLKEFEKVDRMYWRLHCCLLLSLWRRLTSPLLFYARVISVLTDLRGLVFNGRQLMYSFRPEMLKLTKDIQVPLYIELLFTQANTIPDVELK